MSHRWEELVEGLESSSNGPVPARSLHSRVGSSSASTTRSNPDSPGEAPRNRERLFEVPSHEDVIIRAKSTTGRRQNSHSSSMSNAAVRLARSDSRDEIQYDSTSPPRSSHDDAVFGSHSRNPARHTYVYGASGLQNLETGRTKDRNASRDMSSPREVPRRDQTRTPAQTPPPLPHPSSNTLSSPSSRISPFRYSTSPSSAASSTRPQMSSRASGQQPTPSLKPNSPPSP